MCLIFQLTPPYFNPRYTVSFPKYRSVGVFAGWTMTVYLSQSWRQTKFMDMIVERMRKSHKLRTACIYIHWQGTVNARRRQKQCRKLAGWDDWSTVPYDIKINQANRLLLHRYLRSAWTWRHVHDALIRISVWLFTCQSSSVSIKTKITMYHCCITLCIESKKVQ